MDANRVCGVCHNMITEANNAVLLNKDNYFGVRYAHSSCFYCSHCGRQLDPALQRSYTIEQKDPVAKTLILCTNCSPHTYSPPKVFNFTAGSSHSQSSPHHINVKPSPQQQQQPQHVQPLSPSNHLLTFVDNSRARRSLFNENNCNTNSDQELSYDEKTQIILNKAAETKALAARFLDKNHLSPSDGVSRSLETLKSENDYLKSRLLAAERRVEEAERYSNQLYETNKVIDFNLSMLSENVKELVTSVNTEKSKLNHVQNEATRTKRELDETVQKLSRMEIQNRNDERAAQIEEQNKEIKALKQELVNERARMERLQSSTAETYKHIQQQYESEVKKLKEKEKAQKKVKECSVCMDNEPNVVILPCAHVCCCRACSVKVTTCPLCRGSIAAKHVVFL
eukprot:TRINITY_DN3803_c0_g1_i1.p1 TRINITY_DN3803_c0_g1~~TRINITY_DN3803_c0_g1_i1.p1  ORF type:complete len:397 (-),score=55.20 TRINITY_DN3803_c0_g1_i1:85-1275(-)